MTPEQWQQVKEVFQAALERPSSDRTRFLERACRGNAALRREVESLLAADEADSFLETPVANVAALQVRTSAESRIGRLAKRILGRTGGDRALRCPSCFAPAASGRTCSVCERDRPGRDSSLALPEGTLLADQFLIGRVLGSGGFGITYLAWDTRLETRVAIKEYFARELSVRRPDRASVTPSQPEQADALQYGLEGFLREARALARFDHPHIVRVKTYFEANGTGYIVMNYYEGLSLQAVADQQGKPLSETQALAIMVPVLDGLQVVHEHGLLHRDIKPSNIYLADRLGPVLLDFGTARVAAGERSHSLTVILTHGFAPPEQYHSRGNQGPWTDIYACAATLYYLVSGSVPPEAHDRLMGEDCVPLQQRGSPLSASFCAAIQRGLALRPEARPQQVREFQAQLVGRQAPVDRRRRREGGKVACVHCGVNNRVPSDWDPTTARCGRCGQGLLDESNLSTDLPVRCRSCGAKNRLRSESVARARCGKCGEVLEP
jgi:serine/threonine protein kinase